MKGFIYLLEISVALILMLTVIGTLSGVNVKKNWEKPELISTGRNLAGLMNYANISKILNNNFSEIEAMLPPNIDFGLKINGIPKSNITVGCVDYCSFIEVLLTPTYVNGYWINFTVTYFNINSLNHIPYYYDAVVFVNYTDYALRKSNITDYINRGGVVIGINDTYSNSDTGIRDIFGLNPIGSAGGDSFHFSSYNPSVESIEKYFLGLGINVSTTNTIDSKKWGDLTLWQVSRKINISSSGLVDVEAKAPEEGSMQSIPEGGTFKLKGPDSILYTFKVKKIFWDTRVFIQPLNTSFVFKDFSDSNDVIGNFNIISLPGGQAEMTSNNSAIWISFFPTSDEYKTLVKSAIASRVNSWYAKQADFNKENVAVSSFFPLCCDMPETAELTFYLWYKI